MLNALEIENAFVREEISTHFWPNEQKLSLKNGTACGISFFRVSGSEFSGRIPSSYHRRLVIGLSPGGTKMAAGPPPRPAPPSRALPGVPERLRSRQEAREPRGQERPRPGAWERRAGAGEGRPDVSGAAISCFSAVFPQLWVVAAAGLRLPVGGGRGGVDSGPGTPRPAARSCAPARPPRPESAASRVSARPPPRPSERPRCRPSSVWWWETGECAGREPGRGPGPGGLAWAGSRPLSGAGRGARSRRSLPPGPNGTGLVPAFFFSFLHFWWGRESPTGGRREK